MDVTRTIQAAVVRADLLLCRVAAWPWKRLALSLLLAAVAIRVIKAVREQ